MLWILIIGVYIIVALIMAMVMSYMNRNKKEWYLEDDIGMIIGWPLMFAAILVISPFFLLWKFAKWCHKMMYNNYHDKNEED